MTIGDVLPATAIVLLVLLIGLGLAMMFSGISRLRAQQKPKIELHRLVFCKQVTRIGRPDDYFIGWQWECSCGRNNGLAILDGRLPQREHLAVLEFIAHRERVLSS